MVCRERVSRNSHTVLRPQERNARTYDAATGRFSARDVRLNELDTRENPKVGGAICGDPNNFA